MRLNLVPVIYRKEMLDTVRDRRTLISMVVVPIMAMPLLFFVIGHFMSSAERRAGEEAVTIAVRGGEALPGLLDLLKESGFRLASPEDIRAAMDNKQIAAWLEPAAAAGGATVIRIYADDTRQASELAARKIQAALDRFKQDKITARLRSMGVSETVLKPFTVKRINIAPEKKMAGFFWGSLIGYIVVLLMFSGGMYPAIDMTAGEKERRTLEIFLSTPAGRNEIVLGKILATTSAVFVTAMLSISSLLVSFRYSSFGKSSDRMKETLGRIPLDAQTLALVIVALAPMAIMAASLMIAIALLAKSFKEAQSYLTPLVMAVVFPLVVGMLPGIQLTPLLALVPLFNVCQLIKEIFVGEFSWVAFAVTMLANLVYAGVAFLGAVWVFKDERVLFRT
jgi:sodium transport system permease protein